MKTSTVDAMAARPRMRAMMLMTLVAALVLTLHVPALALTQVNLHGAHVGAESESFQTETDDGGLADAVVWHFILNGLDHGAPGGTLYVTFASAGSMMATGIPVGVGATQHFYVGTPAHDTIVSAFVLVDSEGYNNLVLSHVALNVVVEEPPAEEPPVEEPPVEEPPVEEPPVEEPPVEEPPIEEPPVEEPPLGEEPPATEEPPVVTAPPGDPFLPFTEEEPVVTAEIPASEKAEMLASEEPEPFLPYTGADFGILSLLAAASAALGTGFRKLGMR